MKSVVLKIEGMSCGHCVMSVKKALAKLPGVAVLSADIGRAVVTIDEAAAGEQELVDAVSEAGYTVLELSEPDAA